MSLTLKIYFTLPSGKQEIRRWTTSTDREVLPPLLAFLEATYSRFYAPPLRFLVQYDDDEELITVSSEVELQEGLQLHLASNATAGTSAVWKLFARFDDSPVSASSAATSISSPMAEALLSGVATPSLAALNLEAPLLDFPPSPSRVHAESFGDDQAAAVVEPSFVADTPSTRSDEVDLVDVESPSDDEFVRVDDQPASPSGAADAPTAETPASVAIPVAVDTQPEAPAQVTEAAAAPAAVADDSELSVLIDQRGPERFACCLCGKLFAGCHFVVKHLRSRHTEAIAPVLAKLQPTNEEPTASTVPTSTSTSTSTSTTGTSTDPTPSVEFSTQTDAAASRVHSETTATQTVTSLPVVEVEPTPSARSPVEIEDVTGHHEHVQPTPAPDAPLTPPPKETASSSSSSAVGEVVHSGITCDGCGLSPITGVRFHCTYCVTPGGYDLCAKCEQAGDKHPASHVLLKMRVPAHIPVGTAQRHLSCPYRRPGVTERPRAEFVGDVTLADGLHVRAGETLTKVWSVKNVGACAWPVGTRVVVSGGDLAPESEERTDPFGACVPAAAPGETVHISVAIHVPNEVGRFRATFRLEAPDRTRFGPRVWVDLVVPEEKEEEKEPVPAPAAKEQSVPVKTAPVVESAPQAAPAPVCASAPAPTPAPVPVSAPAVVAPARPAEQSAPSEQSALASAFIAHHASAAAAVSARVPSFPYSNQLATLRGMGFTDVELCKYLLLNNKGDLQKVVAWLLSQ